MSDTNAKPAAESLPSIDAARALAVLARLGACPTAPRHEIHVARAIVDELQRLDLRTWSDEWGNLYARIRRGAGAPPIALVAHMDHPGFELIGAPAGAPPTAAVVGGLAPEIFAEPVAINFFRGDDPTPIAARAIACQDDGPGNRSVTLEFGAMSPDVKPGDFGVLDLPNFIDSDGLLHMRAVDDLAGCGSILAAMAAIAASTSPCDVYGVFTRAEEVGLVGASLLSRAGHLPKETLVVSLETSPTLPGAEVGGGPVIRVGDAASAFHPDVDAVMLVARQRFLDNEAKIQRQLMSGGVCEATTFNRSGYRSAGVCLAMTNYHNRSTENRPAAETISRDDFLGCAALLAALPDAAIDPAPTERIKRIQAAIDTHEPRLRATAASFARLANARGSD